MFRGEWGRNPADLMDRKERFVRDEAHESALRLAHDALRVNAMRREDFVGHYSKEVIESDTAYVLKRQRQFAEDEQKDPQSAIMKEKALILQAMIHQNGANWLGDERVRFIRTDDYDDIYHGVDEVVELPRDPGYSHLALNIDVTFASSLDHKFDEIDQSIREERLGSVKYFANDGFRGELRLAPRLIVGAHATKLEQMQRLWLNPRAKLGQHPFRFFMLEELLQQTEAFAAYAKRLNKPKVSEVYLDAHKGLLQRQKKIGPPNEEIREEIQADFMVNALGARLQELAG